MKTVQLNKKAALKVMETAEYRLTPTEDAGTEFAVNGIQILYDGEWWDVVRTDLADDVSTAPGEVKTLDEWVCYYTERCEFGVRLKRLASSSLNPLRKNHIFAVVDAESDG